MDILSSCNKWNKVILKIMILGEPWWLIARWDGLRNQLPHVVLHFLVGLIDPETSITMALTIEGVQGFVGKQNQGFDLIDLGFRSLGILLGIVSRPWLWRIILL